MSRNWGSKNRGMEVPGKKEVTKNHVFSRRPRGSGRPCFPGCLRDFCCICDNSQNHSPAVTVRRGTSLLRFSSWAPHEKHRPQSRTSRGQSPPSHTVPVMLASALWASRNFLFGKKKMGLMCLTQLWQGWMRLFMNQPYQPPLFCLCLHRAPHRLWSWPGHSPLWYTSPTLPTSALAVEWFLLVSSLLSTGSYGYKGWIWNFRSWLRV